MRACVRVCVDFLVCIAARTVEMQMCEIAAFISRREGALVLQFID